MKVSVRLFAQARESAGVDRFECDVPSTQPDIEALLRQVRSQRGVALHDALTAPGVRVAVNRELVDLDHRLADGDEVAFLPRVTGG